MKYLVSFPLVGGWHIIGTVVANSKEEAVQLAEQALSRSHYPVYLSIAPETATATPDIEA